MIEVSFHKELYAAEAIAEARATYEGYATLYLAEEAHRWVLKISATTDDRAERIASELSNFALGRTIERGTRPLQSEDARPSAKSTPPATT